MDIKALAERMRVLVCQPAEGDTLISFLQRCRQSSLAKWDFWRLIVRLVREQIRAVLNSSLKTPYLVAFFLVLSLVHSFVYASSDDYTATTKIDLPKPEISRGPPKRFIPIPKTEIGGCARSDNTVPAI